MTTSFPKFVTAYQAWEDCTLQRNVPLASPVEMPNGDWGVNFMVFAPDDPDAVNLYHWRACLTPAVVCLIVGSGAGHLRLVGIKEEQYVTTGRWSIEMTCTTTDDPHPDYSLEPHPGKRAVVVGHDMEFHFAAMGMPIASPARLPDGEWGVAFEAPAPAYPSLLDVIEDWVRLHEHFVVARVPMQNGCEVLAPVTKVEKWGFNDDRQSVSMVCRSDGKPVPLDMWGQLLGERCPASLADALFEDGWWSRTSSAPETPD